MCTLTTVYGRTCKKNPKTTALQTLYNSQKNPTIKKTYIFIKFGFAGLQWWCVFTYSVWFVRCKEIIIYDKWYTLHNQHKKRVQFQHIKHQKNTNVWKNDKNIDRKWLWYMLYICIIVEYIIVNTSKTHTKPISLVIYVVLGMYI